MKDPLKITDVTFRPADLFEPKLDKARESIKDFTKDTGDVLINALYPITGLRFLSGSMVWGPHPLK